MSLASLIGLRGAVLLEGLERHVPGSREHADATAAYAFAIAVELGFERARAETVRETARLHDSGKVYVAVELLAKPAAELTPVERDRLDGRFEAGYRLALGAGIPEQACDWILRFGERWDGDGPEGLAGDAIPIEARIVRAACMCDSILAQPATSRDAQETRRDHAVGELRAAAGGELDPEVVEALVAVLERATG